MDYGESVIGERQWFLQKGIHLIGGGSNESSKNKKFSPEVKMYIQITACITRSRGLKLSKS
jgi:hypothetical protein